jgi:hypothetical protein
VVSLRVEHRTSRVWGERDNTTKPLIFKKKYIDLYVVPGTHLRKKIISALKIDKSSTSLGGLEPPTFRLTAETKCAIETCVYWGYKGGLIAHLQLNTLSTPIKSLTAVGFKPTSLRTGALKWSIRVHCTWRYVIDYIVVQTNPSHKSLSSPLSEKKTNILAKSPLNYDEYDAEPSLPARYWRVLHSLFVTITIAQWLGRQPFTQATQVRVLGRHSFSRFLIFFLVNPEFPLTKWIAVKH